MDMMVDVGFDEAPNQTREIRSEYEIAVGEDIMAWYYDQPQLPKFDWKSVVDLYWRQYFA